MGKWSARDSFSGAFSIFHAIADKRSCLEWSIHRNHATSENWKEKTLMLRQATKHHNTTKYVHTHQWMTWPLAFCKMEIHGSPLRNPLIAATWVGFCKGHFSSLWLGVYNFSRQEHKRSWWNTLEPSLIKIIWMMTTQEWKLKKNGTQRLAFILFWKCKWSARYLEYFSFHSLWVSCVFEIHLIFYVFIFLMIPGGYHEKKIKIKLEQVLTSVQHVHGFWYTCCESVSVCQKYAM